MHTALDQLRLELEPVDLPHEDGERSPVIRRQLDRRAVNEVIRTHFGDYLSVVKIVCKAQAFDPLQRNSEGKTALEMAEELGFSSAAHSRKARG